MTDEELVSRLRGEPTWAGIVKAAKEAATRIEELRGEPTIDPRESRGRAAGGGAERRQQMTLTIWEVTRCRDWTARVMAERFEIIDGALVFFSGAGAVLAFAPDWWASVVPCEEEDKDHE